MIQAAFGDVLAEIGTDPEISAHNTKLRLAQLECPKYDWSNLPRQNFVSVAKCKPLLEFGINLSLS
jgi:hypothetical protein